MKIKINRDPNPEDGGNGNNIPAQQVSFEKGAGDIRSAVAADKGSAVLNQPEKAVPESIKNLKFDISDEAELNDDTKGISKEFIKPKEVAKPDNKDSEIKQPEIKKEVESKKELNAKFPDKKVEPSKAPDAKPEVHQQNKETPQPRDYSIFPKEVQEHLKKTGGEAFDFIKKTYSDLTKAQEEVKLKSEVIKKIQEGGQPDNWYEHPDAWQLAPQAIQSQNRLARLEQEEGFWREQISQIQAGNKFRMLKGWNQQGQLVVGEEMEPSKQAETDLFLKLGRYQSEKNSEAVRLNTFAQNYSNQYKAFTQEAEAILDKEWPWRNDDNHEGQKARKEFLGVLPKELHGNIGFQCAALLYSTVQALREQLAAKNEEAKKEVIIDESKKLAEPALRSPSIGNGEKSGVRTMAGGRKIPAVFDINGM